MRADSDIEMESVTVSMTSLSRLQNGLAEVENRRLTFYFLVALTLVTAVMSLYLRHQIMSIHRHSVEQHHLWMNRLGEYVELSRLASNILVPIRDVFTSHEVDGEQTKMYHAFETFATHRHKLRRDLEDNVQPATAAPLLEDLEMIDDSVTRIVEEGGLLYAAFAQHHFDKADRLLARVSDLHRDINDLLAFLRDDVRLIQQRQYDAEQVELTSLQRYEMMLAIIVFLAAGWIIFRECRQTKRVRRDTEQMACDHENLREAESRLRAIVNHLADGVVTLRPNGCIDSWNKAAEHIFGYPEHQIIGNHFCILLASPDREAFAIAFQEVVISL